ncbi:hypothetical protein [Alkalisalibacterium limincola]|uniref:Uncharacterized protein n=1 Tax=Alkalisalibacterium limincola TaxID=2699169 RepID=A0A5C8KNV7_9GAMM|nr:hypothetical protein [Alkalisalibacterium limincola]TXK62298.1 hypothetical protein FU658_08665 [Alkalisalibacterium limincola]
MRSLFTLGLLLLAFAASAPTTGWQPAAAMHPPSTMAAGTMPVRALGPRSMAAAPRPAADAVEPAERVSEPEGAFGFARILLGLLVAAIVGAVFWIGSRYARRRREGGPRRDA